MRKKWLHEMLWIILLVQAVSSRRTTFRIRGKNGFVTATKLGTTNDFLLLQPKILLQQPNVLLL